MNWRVDYRMFRDNRSSRDEIFDEAAAFASQFTAEQVIGLTTAVEKDHVIAVVWYWSSGSFWVCPKCGESIEDQFESCWKCTTAKPQIETSSAEAESRAGRNNEKPSAVAYRLEQGSWLEWDDFLAEISKLASAIGPERLISIGHSGSKDDALGTVFYLGSTKTGDGI